ncbi:unnamed protein product [Oikopleura dioica]|uniref:Uncharacterized protein n=1 Tax=Oikopleura dioica TaxID=34765 RepID=E4WWY1_OIKDI|nr:unnamed protein product [Oikopleura dioica]
MQPLICRDALQTEATFPFNVRATSASAWSLQEDKLYQLKIRHKYIDGTRKHYPSEGEPACNQTGGLTLRWQTCSITGENGLRKLTPGAESTAAPILVISGTKVAPKRENFKFVVGFTVEQDVALNVAFPSGIGYIYKVNIRWPSSDAACLQRLELQTPYQKLRLIRDFTESARMSKDGMNRLVYFDSPCEPLPVTRKDYNSSCLEKYEWAFDN